MTNMSTIDYKGVAIYSAVVMPYMTNMYMYV